MRLRISCLAALAALWLAPAPWRSAAAAMPAAQDFELGMQAFRAGDYDGALRSFLEARRAGLNTPGLAYDLGATYYRLGRYVEAVQEFEALVRDSQWAPLARYNLGLTAQRMGLREQAMQHFEAARHMTADPNLRTLAATALERLTGDLSSRRTGVVASLAVGYDTNATLSPDAATTGASNHGDTFAEATAAASHRLVGNAARGWHAQGGLVLRKYWDLNQFDLTGLRLGLSHETGAGRLQTSAGAYVDKTYVGSEPFQRSALLDAQARIDAAGELRARYQFERIAGGAGFEYLDGWQQRLSGEAGFTAQPALVRAGYQIELNHRRDLEQGGDFSSYSPTRQSLFSTIILPDVSGWRAEVRGEYRVSRYGDPYRFNAGALEVTRRDERYGIAARASRRLSPVWRAFVDYSYTRNRSTLESYDYDRQQLMAGIEAALER
jgi:tetratricopeptide (TPR) repeat protein